MYFAAASFLFFPRLWRVVPGVVRAKYFLLFVKERREEKHETGRYLTVIGRLLCYRRGPINPGTPPLHRIVSPHSYLLPSLEFQCYAYLARRPRFVKWLELRSRFPTRRPPRYHAPTTIPHCTLVSRIGRAEGRLAALSV